MEKSCSFIFLCVSIMNVYQFVSVLLSLLVFGLDVGFGYSSSWSCPLIFFCGGGRRRGISTEKKHTKNNRYSLTFCAHALYKISSSWVKWFSSFNTNKRSNGQVMGITLPMFYRFQSKVILTTILNNFLNFRIIVQAILYILC